MKYSIIKLLLLASIVAIVLLVIQPNERTTYSQEEVETISKTLGNAFNRAKEAARKKEAANNTDKKMDSEQQSILAVIYKKTKTTWFFKAKDSVKNINQISADFKNYFIDQLEFDQNEQPVFSHIPESMITNNSSSMRVATYRIEGVEVSVTKLSGQQDTFANVKRWMGQIGLPDNAPIQLDFKDDRNTIIVKMPKQ